MKKIGLSIAVSMLPMVAFAAGDLGNVKSLIKNIGEIISLLIPIVFALALLYFFWGLAKYILSGGEDKEAGKKIMIWGIVALFVMASVWGIVKFMGEALGLNSGATVTPPSVQL